MSLLESYDSASYRDEALDEGGSPRAHYRPVLAALDRMGADELTRRVELREVVQRSRGVTFTMRTEGAETERTFPLDLVPRIIPAPEWAHLEDGLHQRVRASSCAPAVRTNRVGSKRLRRRPELNRGTGICSPLPNHSATPPLTRRKPDR